ncbi:hypothetical protein BPNPMPFG_007382 (plasmid) [Mesorhizobium sp. AR07]|uniref:Uncharacterized protein n=1 Tax=Mesorhizobium huakuii TaxID=28104 RepID=A0A7G6T5H3_9HYPH|nr:MULTISPECIES: hypothetical protein [Mesorhizobium]QND62005.1 hypothetical protein HB778_38410 [Mesorhizobium huakuii]UVK48860.1 hypothetical protein BPNPMPFG_007382 [Mesorhizobium sp. AR07]
MRQQKRPFVVEIKQKRGLVKRPQSIWGGIDLATISSEVAEAKTEDAIAEATPQPIFPGEDVRSEPMLAIGEAESDVKHVITPDAALPEPPTVEEAPVPEASNAPGGDRQTRRKKRWQDDVPLPRGERWKRRLPWVLRQRRR